MTDQTFTKQQYFSAEDCQTLYPPGTPYGNDHPNGWQDMADRLNALLASRVQAPTVVVPELTEEDLRENCDPDRKSRNAYYCGYQLASQRAHTIPQHAVGGDGMVAVDRNTLLSLFYVDDNGGPRFPTPREKSVLDSLRANQGGAAT